MEKIKSTVIFLQQWGHENFIGFPGIMQIGAIVITCLLALIVKQKVRLYFENIRDWSKKNV